MKDAMNEMVEFQSLFCWKTLANKELQTSKAAAALEFQSLFCWKTLANSISHIGAAGTYQVSILVLLEDPRQLRGQTTADIRTYLFQSLFCWKTLANPWAQLPTSANTCWFQSLFCWKTLANLEPVEVEIQVERFQSLFCWKTLANENTLRNQQYLGRVSILVLLEDPRQPAPAYQAVARLMFQSLFCWKTLANQKIHPILGGKK